MSQNLLYSSAKVECLDNNLYRFVESEKKDILNLKGYVYDGKENMTFAFGGQPIDLSNLSSFDFSDSSTGNNLASGKKSTYHFNNRATNLNQKNLLAGYATPKNESLVDSKSELSYSKSSFENNQANTTSLKSKFLSSRQISVDSVSEFENKITSDNFLLSSDILKHLHPKFTVKFEKGLYYKHGEPDLKNHLDTKYNKNEFFSKFSFCY